MIFDDSVCLIGLLIECVGLDSCDLCVFINLHSWAKPTFFLRKRMTIAIVGAFILLELMFRI